MIHVGDSVSSDVAGAHDAGIASAWIKNPARRLLSIESRAMPKHIVAHVGELADLFGA